MTVFHFYELCSKILGEDVAYENEDSDYYAMIDEETLSKVGNTDLRYDAILVDEGQDFSDNMYKILTTLLSKQTNNLTIALDDNQDIYRRKASWKEVGIQARGRTHRIGAVYRNTREIADFADRFIKRTPEKETVKQQKELFSDFYDYHGPPPEFIKLSSYNEIAEYTAEQTKAILESERCPLSEIAVIYAKKSTGDNAAPLIPKMIESSLNQGGILCNWVSENIHAKKSYDITTDRVTISTIHSVKGLDYAYVFLVGLDLLDESRWSKDQIQSLTYVAITRAKYQLLIPYIQHTPLIDGLLRCDRPNKKSAPRRKDR